jgi:hypothetical protein
VEPLFQRSQPSTPNLGRQEAGGNSSEASVRANPGSELKRVVDAAAQRVDEIVDGAERVASEILAEAEAEAARYVDERRREVEQVIDEWSADLNGLAELLSRREGTLRELTEGMISELEEISGVLRRIPPAMNRWHELSPDASSSAEPNDSQQGELLDSPEPAVGEAPVATTGVEAPAEPEVGANAVGHESAVLRAAQMAVGGSSREEIERALSTELAISDPGPIVDELFGPRA